MLLPIPRVLEADELALVRALLAAAPFVDGRLSAGGAARRVKNNEEMDPAAQDLERLNRVVMGSLAPRLMKIPPRIMHGWKALTAPEVLVVNAQTHVYDPADEFKYPWDCVLTEVWEPKNG